MAALPNTGISISMVKAAIGAGTNDLGALFLHPNVNEWGFNCPDTAINNVIWGADETFRETLSPNSLNYQQLAGDPPGYHLGNFRGYDHDWVVYQYNDFFMTPNGYFSPMSFTYKIEEADLKLLSKTNPNIFLQFKPKFRRTVTDSWIDLDMFTIHTSDKEATFNISAQNPPDFATNGVLAQNEKFQLMVEIITPEVRRWTEQNKVSPLVVFDTPISTYSNIIILQNEILYAAKPTNVMLRTVSATGGVWGDREVAGLAVVTGEVSNTAAFTNKYYPNPASSTVNVPKSVPQGYKYAGNFSLDFTDSGILAVVNVGSTVWCKLYLNGEYVRTIQTVVGEGEM